MNTEVVYNKDIACAFAYLRESNVFLKVVSELQISKASLPSTDKCLWLLSWAKKVRKKAIHWTWVWKIELWWGKRDKMKPRFSFPIIFSVILAHLTVHCMKEAELRRPPRPGLGSLRTSIGTELCGAHQCSLELGGSSDSLHAALQTDPLLEMYFMLSCPINY